MTALEENDQLAHLPLKIQKNYRKFRGGKHLKLKKYLFCIYLEIESSNILVLWRSPFYPFSTVNTCTFLPSLNLSLSSLSVCGFFSLVWLLFFCFTSMYRLSVYFWGNSISYASRLKQELLPFLPHPFPLSFAPSFLPLFPSSIWSCTHYFR